MKVRKQQLVKRHRRNKRLALLVLLASTLVSSITISPWLLPLVPLLGWLINEAWFSDHIFYSPREDYLYRFPDDVQPIALHVTHGRWRFDNSDSSMTLDKSTLIARVRLRSTWLGRLLDPVLLIGNDRQTFERGARGLRYVNLTGQGEALSTSGLSVLSRYCVVGSTVELFVFGPPEGAIDDIMILAPHADDAELAAFGLYSAADRVNIVTLTQGEIEAQYYQRLGLGREEASQLKGRLRTWDSLSIPLWGGVAAKNCIQLGYYCMQLSSMEEQPDIPFGSKESGETDIRTARQHNGIELPADADGLPTWSNLVADLAACLMHFKPRVVVMPHPELDPHADHIASTRAFFQALNESDWQPEQLLLYANHLHDNDRWPMGDANTGVALPPAMVELPADEIFSFVLNSQQQLDKAMALLMHHDLQPPLPFKKLLRRQIQRVLAGRRWPNTGENEFLRKAVRKHEIFWVRNIEKYMKK